VRERACHLFTLLGAAGVGKSRLAAEALAAIGDRAAVLQGRCLPYGDGITFWPLVELLQGLDLAEALAGEPDGEIVLRRVRGAVGEEEAGGSIEETLWAVRRLLEALARRRPLVVLFEDVHWGEPTFLDLVEYIADWSRDAPILVACLARPELLDARPGWAGGKLNASSILLEPLSEEECEELIESLLGRAGLDEASRARIADAAEGNPLFVEEMLEMLIDDGLLLRDNGGWTPTGDLSTVAVPPTIQALVAARLDRLGDEEREVLERAAVVGKSSTAGPSPSSRPKRADRRWGRTSWRSSART
jgi:predicted ATPase